MNVTINEMPNQSQKTTVVVQHSRGARRTLLAVLLCVVIFASTIAVMVMIGVKTTVSEKGLRDLTGEVLSEVGNITLPSFPKVVEKDVTMVEVILILCEGKDVALDAGDVESLLMDDQIIDLLSHEIYTYLKDIQEGKRNAVIDEEGFRGIVNDIEALIEEKLNVQLSNSGKDEIVETVMELGILEFTDADVLKQEAPEVYQGVRYGLENNLVWAVSGLILLLVAILLLVNRMSVMQTIGDVGITATVAGALYTTLVVLIRSASVRILTGHFIVKLIEILLGCMLKNFIVVSLCVLGVGVLLIVTSKWLLSRERKHAE